MTAIIICGQMQFFVAAVGFAQLVEQLDEQLPILAVPRNPMEASCFEVERSGDPHLRFVPGVLSGLCLPFRIQQKPTLGLVSSRVSSWKKEPAFSAISRMSLSLLRF